MYIVVSKWRSRPGRDVEFEDSGQIIQEKMRGKPGIVLFEAFRGEDGVINVVHAYDSEATYNRLINDPESDFAKAAAMLRIDELGEWLGSERGESLSFERVA